MSNQLLFVKLALRSIFKIFFDVLSLF